MLAIFLIYIIEYIILGAIRVFTAASSYDKIPDKSLFWESTAWILINNYQDFLKGIGVTLSISLLGTIFGLVFALVLALLRIMKVSDKDSEFKAFFKKIGIGFSKGYIGLFRGTPMMVQAILFYYLVPFAISQATGISMDTMNKIFTWFVAGLITVTLNTTAYLAEVLRGGIESLDKGQMEAARSLGMTYPQAMIHVILPQALKNSMPSIGNEFVINIKDTSVLNVISVIDLFFVASRIQGATYRFNEPFLIAACIYLILTFSTTKILSIIDKKMDIEEKPLPSAN
jgi:putative lysine transport system permease protein